jgi:hypothetical protein
VVVVVQVLIVVSLMAYQYVVKVNAVIMNIDMLPNVVQVIPINVLQMVIVVLMVLRHVEQVVVNLMKYA